MTLVWLTHDQAATTIAALIAESKIKRAPALSRDVERVIGLVGAAGVGKTSISGSLAMLFNNQGTSCTHVVLDGFLYPREIRQQLWVNGYQLQGWQECVAEKTLRSLLCDGETVCIPEYLPDGIHGPGVQVRTASHILLDGNYALLGPIGELVDTWVFFNAELETLKKLRYDRDVIREGRFTPEQERAVWDNEIDSLKKNILRRKNSAQIHVRPDKDRRYQVSLR